MLLFIRPKTLQSYPMCDCVISGRLCCCGQVLSDWTCQDAVIGSLFVCSSQKCRCGGRSQIRKVTGESEDCLGDLSIEVSHVEPMLSQNGFICFVTGLNVMNPDRSWNGLSYVMLSCDTGLFNCKIKENIILN